MMFFLILWIFLEPLLCSNSRCDNYTHKSSWLLIFRYQFCLFLLVFHELSAEPLSLSIDFYPPGVTFPSSLTHRSTFTVCQTDEKPFWLTPLWHTDSDTQMRGANFRPQSQWPIYGLAGSPATNPAWVISKPSLPVSQLTSLYQSPLPYHSFTEVLIHSQILHLLSFWPPRLQLPGLLSLINFSDVDLLTLTDQMDLPLPFFFKFRFNHSTARHWVKRRAHYHLTTHFNYVLFYIWWLFCLGDIYLAE